MSKVLGGKIAFFRKKRGLTQKELGGLVDRSHFWVSQVERGVRAVDSMDMLQRLADVLEVPLGELAADAPVVVAASERPPAAVALRLLLASSQALGAVLREQPVQDLDSLRARVARAWDLVHASQYDDLTTLLTGLLPELESATRGVGGKVQRSLFAVLAKANYATAAALARLGQTDAAWVAADRGLHNAERSGDPLLMAEGSFRVTLVFQAAREFDLAKQTASTAVEALTQLADSGRPEALSLRGSLLLQLAVIAGRRNDPDAAYDWLARARADAERLGEDRNDYNTEFGPANVALQTVSVAVELSDTWTALRHAEAVDTTKLSAERRSRLLLDVARAHLQRRHADRASLEALLEAERIAPDTAHHHGLARQIMHDLLQGELANDPDLTALITRSQNSTQNAS